MELGYGRAPIGFNWTSAENKAGGVNFFELICDSGWTGVGTVAVQSPEELRSRSILPSADVACCVPVYAAQHGGAITQLWQDEGPPRPHSLASHAHQR